MVAKLDETMRVVIDGIKQIIVDDGDRESRSWIGSSLTQELDQRIGMSVGTSAPILKILRSLGVLTKEEVLDFKVHGNTKFKGKQWRWTLNLPNAVVLRGENGQYRLA